MQPLSRDQLVNLAAQGNLAAAAQAAMRASIAQQYGCAILACCAPEDGADILSHPPDPGRVADLAVRLTDALLHRLAGQPTQFDTNARR